MAYTPELNKQACCTLRRIAWALNLPMTKVINEIFTIIPQLTSKDAVCTACKDKTKCELCGYKNIKEQATISLLLENKKIGLASSSGGK